MTWQTRTSRRLVVGSDENEHVSRPPFFFTGLTLILVLAGEYFGGGNGASLAFIMAAAMNFFSYFYSDKIALACTGRSR